MAARWRKVARQNTLMGVLPEVLTVLILTVHTPPALIARIPTAHIVRPVRRRPTAVIVQPLTAALIIQRLALKPEEHGTVLTARCRNRQAPLTAAPLRILPPLVLKPEELGTARLALCRTRAVQAAPPRTPPPPAGCSGK